MATPDLDTELAALSALPLAALLQRWNELTGAPPPRGAAHWTCNGFGPISYITMPPWLRTQAG